MELLALDRRDADLSKPESLRAVLRAARPNLILNAAAYTAVDRAESEPELADLVNHQAPRVLAEEAHRLGALLIHYSTDYVFDGTKSGPWLEDDSPSPLSTYGAGKLKGEQAIAASCENYLILRTSWVYANHGNNFLRTMLRLGAERSVLRVVNDQWGAPTSAAALADATRAMADRMDEAPAQRAGIYHATCSGKTTWCGFAEAIFEAQAEAQSRTGVGKVLPRVEGIAGADYPTPALRPKNSVLDNSKLRTRFNVQLPAWEDALLEVMANHREPHHTGTIKK